MAKRMILVVGALLLLFHASAGAQAANPSGEPGAIVTAAPNDSAGTITFAVNGFKPGTVLSCTIASTPTHLGSTTVDSSGHAALTAPLPGDITPGVHTLTASGTGANGQPMSVSSQVQISPTAAANAARNAGLTPNQPPAIQTPAPMRPGPELSRTGRGNAGLLKVGILVLAIGGGVLLFARKRRTRFASGADRDAR